MICYQLSLNLVYFFVLMYQTRERVFHQDIQTLRSGLKKGGTAKVFLTDFKVFGS